jgi:hypothetical protein
VPVNIWRFSLDCTVPVAAQQPVSAGTELDSVRQIENRSSLPNDRRAPADLPSCRSSTSFRCGALPDRNATGIFANRNFSLRHPERPNLHSSRLQSACRNSNHRRAHTSGFAGPRFDARKEKHEHAREQGAGFAYRGHL